MPLYNKKEPYRSMLRELEKEREFTFEGAYILDADEKISEAKTELERVINRNTRGKLPSGLTKEQAQQEMERLSTGIIERIRKGNGRFKSFLYSRGGTRSAENAASKESIERYGANVEYTVMAINGVVILEPLGQPNNATYVAEEKEGLEDAITKLGRGEAIASGYIQKVVHDRYEREGYNYASNHILQLLDYSINSPQDLLKVVKENNGCGLKKISQNMPNTVEQTIIAVSKAVKEKGIDSKDVALVSEEFEGSEKITGKENDDEKSL